jgi:hypothetical protein
MQAAPYAGPAGEVLRELEDQPPEIWLDKISELERAGRAEDAAAVRARFRARYPSHPAAR